MTYNQINRGSTGLPYLALLAYLAAPDSPLIHGGVLTQEGEGGIFGHKEPSGNPTPPVLPSPHVN